MIKSSNITTFFKSIFFIVPLFVGMLPVFAVKPVVITDKDINELHYWSGENILLLEDPEDEITIDGIASGKYDFMLKPIKQKVAITKKLNTTYWAKINVKKMTKDNYSWVFEAYDQSIDEIDFYTKDETGKYVKYEGGDNRKFSKRLYKHKNFVFNINLPYNQEQTIYLRVKCAHISTFIGVVRNVQSFIGYALKEYFFLALFYGLVLSMITFNLLQYLITKLKIYLVYVFYIITAGLFSASNDGLGYQLIWFEFPMINNSVGDVSSLLVIVFMLLLSYEFLRETKIPKSYIQIGLGLLGLRFILFVLLIAGYPIVSMFIIDTIIRIFILTICILALQKGHKQLWYFTLAISTLVIGYTVRELTINGFLQNSIATIYMHLFGESLQMIFISLSLGEKIKIKMNNLVESQEKSLLELEQTNLKTEKLRKNLQKRVEEQIAREKYVSDGISELSTIIANYLNDTDQLYKRISKFIAEYFECRLTALYLVPIGENKLVLVAGYGLDEIRIETTEIEEGDGLLGQCLKDKIRVEIKEVPENYISISSGLGSSKPNLVLLEPLHFNQQIVGVIEMASFHEFTPLQYEVLDKFTAQISSTLSNVQFNETTRKMLTESRQKEEMLRQQEEEMRQQVEELLATQEEFNRKEKEYLKEISKLKSK